MSIKKQYEGVSRKKSLKSYRQSTHLPLPDFLQSLNKETPETQKRSLVQQKNIQKDKKPTQSTVQSPNKHPQSPNNPLTKPVPSKTANSVSKPIVLLPKKTLSDILKEKTAVFPFPNKKKTTQSTTDFIKELKGQFFIMNKISFMGLIFGLVLVSGLFFIAGFFTAMGLNPQHPMTDLPKVTTPAQEIQTKGGATKENNETSPDVVPDVQIKSVPKASDAQQFSVLVDTFSDLHKAKSMVVALTQKGYGAYLVRLPDLNGKTQSYAVRLGVFGNFLDASHFSRTLQSQGYPHTKVIMIAQGEDYFAS